MADLKFYQITDLHYYDHSLGITGKAFEKIANADQKCLAESGAMIDAYIDKILEDKETEIVLISGDVSHDGAMESHKGLLPKLQRFKDAGKRAFVITATHDYYVPGNGTGKAKKCVGDKEIDATSTTREELLELYHDYGLNEALSFHEESHSYTVQLQEGYRLLCLNDDGDREFCGYSKDQLDWIDTQIKEAHQAGDYIFAMTHHPVLPPSPIYPLFSKRDMLGDYEKTAEFLADRGVKFIFTGHTHMQNIAKMTTPAGNDFYDINTCSLVGCPTAMRKVTMTDEYVDVKSIQIEDFDWDLKGKTVNEYVQEQFDFMLNDIFDSLAYDFDHFANDLAIGFSQKPEDMYKMKFLLNNAGKLLQKLTFGGIGKLFFISKHIDPSVKDRKVKDFFVEVVRNVFVGDEPYTPETPEYKAFDALANRVKKLLKGKEDIIKIIDIIKDGVLYDTPPSDWNGRFAK